MRPIPLILLLIGVVLVAKFVCGDSKEQISEPSAEEENDLMISNALKKVQESFGKNRASLAEKIERLETNNFQADFTFETFSPGMDAFTLTYPYGWTSVVKFWSKNPKYKPVGTSSAFERPNNPMPLVVFPSLEAGLMTLAYILSIRNDNAGAYHSTDLGQQTVYNQQIANIVNGYIL